MFISKIILNVLYDVLGVYANINKCYGNIKFDYLCFLSRKTVMIIYLLLIIILVKSVTRKTRCYTRFCAYAQNVNICNILNITIIISKTLTCTTTTDLHQSQYQPPKIYLVVYKCINEPYKIKG
jgi:hypothetical protein